MIMFMDGFEQFKDLDPAVVIAELTAANYAASGAVAPAEGRSPGSVCMTIGAGVNPGGIKRIFNSGAARVVIAFAYQGDTKRDPIVDIANAFKLEWPDKLQINGSKGTITPVLGLWYYYELVIDRTAASITVFINNVQDLVVPLPAAMQNLNTWEVLFAAPADSGKRLDDLFFITSGNPNPTDRIGPQAISARIPSNDVVKEWSAASGDLHYEMVNNRPPLDEEYIQSATSGAQDLFTADESGNGAKITAVGLVVRARKSDIDDRQIGLIIGDKGATQKESLVTTLQTTPTYNYAIFPTDPAGAAWTDTTVHDTPFGVVVRP